MPGVAEGFGGVGGVAGGGAELGEFVAVDVGLMFGAFGPARRSARDSSRTRVA
jgi:hypothetical protein